MYVKIHVDNNRRETFPEKPPQNYQQFYLKHGQRSLDIVTTLWNALKYCQLFPEDNQTISFHIDPA